MALIDLSKGTFTQFFHKTYSRKRQLFSLALYEKKEKCGLKHLLRQDIWHLKGGVKHIEKGSIQQINYNIVHLEVFRIVGCNLGIGRFLSITPLSLHPHPLLQQWFPAVT